MVTRVVLTCFSEDFGVRLVNVSEAAGTVGVISVTEGAMVALTNFFDIFFFIFGDTLREAEGGRRNCDPSLV